MNASRERQVTPSTPGRQPTQPSPASSHASPPQTEGQRLLRLLDHTGGEVGTRVGATRQTVHCWRSGTKTPARPMRDTLEREFGIPAASWERAPVDRPAPRPAKADRSPARTSAAPLAAPLAAPRPAGRPSTLDEVTQLLEELDEDASADGIMPSELARIRDTKTKALALKARIESQDALFESQAVSKHPAWRRIRSIILDELRGDPDVARRIAERLQEVGA